MDEACGPCAYDCPLSYLNQASEPTGYAIEWREKVSQFLETKKQAKRNLVANSVIEYFSEKYQLLYPNSPRRGWVVKRLSDASIFKMSSRQLAQVQFV